jgi:hypothetical protein
MTLSTIFMAFSQSRLEVPQTSMVGWIFIAVAWTVIAAMRLVPYYSSKALRARER